MNADERRLRTNAISEQIIGSAFRVHNELGVGFIEKVYENALAYELRKLGFDANQQEPVNVYYDQAIMGVYFADLLVENLVIVEVKVVKALDDVHLAQCLNYLKATGKSLCLLLNFGTSKVEVKRIVRNF